MNGTFQACLDEKMLQILLKSSLYICKYSTVGKTVNKIYREKFFKSLMWAPLFCGDPKALALDALPKFGLAHTI